MLLNLSNHPSAQWPEKQIQAAKQIYGSVHDIPHPEIDPAATADDVLKLAETFYTTIRELDPDAIHIMGEHSFCHALIPMLQKVGYPCICSTTRRSVEHISDTEVRRKFEFVQFRSYINHQ
jgi:hypothetical protein